MNFYYEPEKSYRKVEVISRKKNFFLERKIYYWQKLFGMTGYLTIELETYYAGADLSICLGMRALKNDLSFDVNTYYYWGQVDLLGNLSSTDFPHWLVFKTDRTWVSSGNLPFQCTFKILRNFAELSNLDHLPSRQVSVDFNQLIPEFIARRIEETLISGSKSLLLPMVFQRWKVLTENLITLVGGRSIPVKLVREKVHGSAGDLKVSEVIATLSNSKNRSRKLLK